MNALSILHKFQARGIRFEVGDAGRLVVDAPKRALDPEEIEQLRFAKSAIIETLLIESATPNFSDRYPIADPRIPPEVAAEIRRIEADAYCFGWTRERLWNREFWPHTRTHPRGLASVLNPGDLVIELNEEFARLKCQSDVLRFFRLDS